MTYGILDCFMISAICGFIFGAVYEVLRIIRRMAKLSIVTVICDVVFFAIAAIVVLQLSLYLGNYIRSYTLIGFGCGVYAYIQTLGRLCSIIEMLIIYVLKNTVGAFITAIADLINKIIGAFAHKCAHQFRRINDFSRPARKKALSLLQFNSKKMYNTKRDIISNGESSRGNNVIKATIRRSS